MSDEIPIGPGNPSGEYGRKPTPKQTAAYLKWHNDPHAVSRYTAKDGERATLLWCEYEELKKDSERLEKLERIFNGTEQYFFNLTDGKPIRQAIDELEEHEI